MAGQGFSAYFKTVFSLLHDDFASISKLCKTNWRSPFVVEDSSGRWRWQRSRGVVTWSSHTNTNEWVDPFSSFWYPRQQLRAVFPCFHQGLAHEPFYSDTILLSEPLEQPFAALTRQRQNGGAFAYLTELYNNCKQNEVVRTFGDMGSFISLSIRDDMEDVKQGVLDLFHTIRIKMYLDLAKWQKDCGNTRSKSNS